MPSVSSVHGNVSASTAMTADFLVVCTMPEVSICRGSQKVTLHGINYFGFEVRASDPPCAVGEL